MLVLLGPGVAASAERGVDGIGIRLVDVPVEQSNNPRARSYIVDALTPGTVISRRIEVSNTTDAALRVDLYPAAASIEEGSFRPADERTGNDLSGWTSLDEATADIPAGGQRLITATVSIPADASPGERYALIWAEVRAAGEGNVALVNRVGVRLYVAVGGDNPAPDQFAADSFTAERVTGVGLVLSARIENTGGRALDLTGSLVLESDDRVRAGPYPIEPGTTLAPGDSGSVRAVIPHSVDDGRWHVTLDLTSGELTRSFTGDVTITSDRAVTTPIESGLPLPAALALGAGILALVLGGFAALVAIRRRTGKSGRRSAARH